MQGKCITLVQMHIMLEIFLIHANYATCYLCWFAIIDI